jgi:hypothetical protein
MARKSMQPEEPSGAVAADSGYVLDNTIISLDPGNGKASGWYFDGKYHVITLPHARVPVAGARIGADNLGAQHKLEFVDWQGERFGIGEGVWDLATRYPVETHQNTESRYGSEMHIFLAVAALAKLKAPSNVPLTIIVPAPPGLINKVSKRIKDAFREGESGANDGRWTMALNGKKPVTYTIGRVITVAEGQGAFSAYRFDINGNVVELPIPPQNHDALSGHVQIVDLGYGTGDTFDIFNGRTAPESIVHSTDPTAGVSTHLLQPVLDKVKELTDATHLTPAHIDGWFRAWTKGYSEANATVTVSGKVLNLQPLFEKVCGRYADWVIQMKLEPAWRNGADSVLEVGGGWLYIDQKVRAYYRKRTILNPANYEHTKGVPLYDLNAYGQLALAANNIRVHQLGGK